MTFLTRHDGVPPDQREPCDIVIKGDCAAPARLSVALLAASTEPTFVTVILAMTRRTARPRLVAIDIAGVAGIALDLGVRGSQRKLRHPVVIKVDRPPPALVVAAVALCAVPAAMDVLNPVTIHACGADILVTFARMAPDAGYSAMRVPQRELRPVVIEGFDAAPYRLGMAAVARLPKPSLVRIVCFVTVEATC